MTNKELQELTASEPLTLNEEYEMQASWRTDDDSNVFIKYLQHLNNNIKTFFYRMHVFNT